MNDNGASHHSRTMWSYVLLLMFLPVWVACTSEGNIRLLEDEVAVALKACTYPNDNVKETNNQRQRRSDDSYDVSSRDDDGMKQFNTYSHERRNSNDTRDALNATNDDYEGHGSTMDELPTTLPQTIVDTNWDIEHMNRTKRSESLFTKADDGQCLSQCVFANLQVVDSRGIPREAELWNKVQTSVTSQQPRAALRDQIRACFQELQSEAEDNGCSYSNKLERCLMLRFSDRMTGLKPSNKNQANDQKPTN